MPRFLTRHPPEPAHAGDRRWPAPLGGPPVRWPRPVDRVADGWWRLPARLRVAAIVLVLGLAAAGLVRRSGQSPWGRPVDVVVAEVDADPGAPVTAQHGTWPADLVPADAVTSIAPDAIASRRIRAGEVLTGDHVARGLDDLLAPGEVAVPLAQDLPDLPDDARVVLLGAGFDGTGRRLASGRLVARDDTWTWVAVARAEAADVAAATATGTVTVAVSRSGPDDG